MKSILFALGWLVCLSTGLRAQSPSSASLTEVPPDLQALLNDLEEETSLSAEKRPEDVVAAVRRYMLPQFVFLFPSRVVDLTTAIAVLESGKFVPKTAVCRDQKYIRQGNTIVVYGLYDQTHEIQGEMKTITNPFFDVFVLTDGSWKFFFSGSLNPVADGAPASKQ